MNPKTDNEIDYDEIARIDLMIRENLLHITNIGEADDEEELEKTWAELNRLCMLRSEIVADIVAGKPKPPLYLAVKSDGTEEGTYLYDLHTGRKLEGVEWFFTGSESEQPGPFTATVSVTLAALDITSPIYGFPAGTDLKKARLGEAQKLGVASLTVKPFNYAEPVAVPLDVIIKNEAGETMNDVFGVFFIYPANAHGSLVSKEAERGPALMFFDKPLSERMK